MFPFYRIMAKLVDLFLEIAYTSIQEKASQTKYKVELGQLEKNESSVFSLVIRSIFY